MLGVWALVSQNVVLLVVGVSGRGGSYCRCLRTCHLLMLCMQAYLDVRCHETCASFIFLVFLLTLGACSTFYAHIMRVILFVHVSHALFSALFLPAHAFNHATNHIVLSGQ